MPVKVYDKRTGKPVEVSSREAQEGIAKGVFSPTDGKIRVARGNETGKVAQDSLQNALADGWRLVDDEEAESIKIAREESGAGAKVLGTAEAGLAGASFGLSTLAEEELLGVDPRRMEARRKAAGPAATGAMIAGALVGGKGLGLGKAALKTERAVASALPQGGSLAARGARSVVPTAVAGGLEGTVYSAGAELDESVLGQRDISASNIAAGGLLGAGLAGTLGVVMPGVSRAVTGAERLGAGASKRVTDAIDGIVPESYEAAVRGVARRTAKNTGADEAKLQELAEMGIKNPSEAYDLMNNFDSHLARTAGEVNDSFNGLRDALDEVVPAISGGAKTRQMSKLIPADGAATVRVHAARNAVDELDATIRKLRGVNEAEAAEVYSVGMLRHYEDRIAGARSKLEDAFKAGDDATAFSVVDDLKRDLDGLNAKRGKSTAFDSKIADTLDELRPAVGNLRGFLTDETYWQGAARAQKEINALATESLQTAEELKGTAIGRALKREAPLDADISLRLAKQYAKGQGADKFARLDAHFDAQRRYLEKFKEIFEATPEQVAAIDKFIAAHEAYKKGLGALGKKAHKLEIVDYAKRVQAQAAPQRAMYTKAAEVAGAVADAAMGGFGYLGAMAGRGLASAVNITHRPFDAFRTLVALGHRADRAGIKIDAAVGKFLAKLRGKGEKAPKPPALPKPRTRKAERAAIATESAVRKQNDDMAEKIRTRVSVLAAHPGMLSEEMDPALMFASEHAPYLTDSLRNKAETAAQFLASKLPKAYEPTFGNGKEIINPIEWSKWLRYVAAVDRPAEVLEEGLANGTLAVEHVEAMKAVHPEILSTVIDTIMTELAAARQAGISVPLEQRMTAGVLLNVPTDDALQPANLAAIQAVHNQHHAEQMLKEMKPKGSVKRAGKPLETATTPASKTEV